LANTRLSAVPGGKSESKSLRVAEHDTMAVWSVRRALICARTTDARPIIGVTFFNTVVTNKGLGLLHEFLPNAAVIALMVNPNNLDDAIVVASDPFFSIRRQQIVALVTHEAIPNIRFSREWVAEGGLMSYGNDVADVYGRAGLYTARILKGENPADLPVDQATRFG
jgi:ABC transporter substrate binding protein